MVHTGPGILFSHFEGLKSPRKRLKVLKGPENLLNPSNKGFRIYVKGNVCRL